MYRQLDGLSLPYPVYVGNGHADKIGRVLKLNIGGPKKVFVVTDKRVKGLFGKKVLSSLKKSGYKTVICDFVDGERDKTPKSLIKMADLLAENGFTREDVVLTLGGGVVGDVGGLLAATYMRGITLVHVPTTIIGQVDSSIGGKTGVNLAAGKNLLGSFYNPSLVICDGDFLKTLPKEEVFNGFGEICKYCILDRGVYDLYTGGAPLSEMVERCIRVKAQFVSEDFKDKAKRRLLNLGHTFGHAVEVASGYTVPHGEGVLYGLKIILDLSLKMEYLPKGEHENLCKFVDGFLDKRSCPYSAEQLLGFVATDKKMRADDVVLALVFGVGKCFTKAVDIEKLKGLCFDS